MNVDIYDDNGEEINYIATEKDVPQWYKKVEDGTTTVTNTFKAPTEEKYDITLEKFGMTTTIMLKKDHRQLNLTYIKLMLTKKKNW